MDGVRVTKYDVTVIQAVERYQRGFSLIAGWRSRSFGRLLRGWDIGL